MTKLELKTTGKTTVIMFKRAIKAQGSVAEGGGHGGSAVRVHDVGPA